MIVILEGANFVGKTSTIESLKKLQPKWNFAYHPRFNTHESMIFLRKEEGEFMPTAVHRDIVYQVSHITCLKYLESMDAPEKVFLLDRCFLSEMVYNENHDENMYGVLLEVLKKMNYKIFYLDVKNKKKLKERIESRYEKDHEKSFGERIENCPDPNHTEEKDEVIKNRMELQKLIDSRFKDLLTSNGLVVEYIDTSNIPQEKVAKKIIRKVKK